MAELIAGVDTSTQSVKIVVRDAKTGQLFKEAKASHPDGTEVDPKFWWEAFLKVVNEIGGLDSVKAISIAGQQHGMVALDKDGNVIRPALLWNDTRSAAQAEALNQKIPNIHKLVGSKLVAAFTASKVLWVKEKEEKNCKKIAAICLPHDYLSWKLSGSKNIKDIFTDRSDASGTGYFDPKTNSYDLSIIKEIIGDQREIVLPKVMGPIETCAIAAKGILIACGAGDNAAAALGLGAEIGDVIVSLGTSGTAFAVSKNPVTDPSGEVAGFCDATGNFLPLVCTLNASRILDAANKVLETDYEELGKLALSANPGSDGLTLLPYFEGERTPNRPDAKGIFSGINLQNFTKANMARAMIEGMLCGLADAIDSLKRNDVPLKRVLLIGGAAKSEAVCKIASAIFGMKVIVPPAGEYVANGAAKQAAALLLGKFPDWKLGESNIYDEKPTPEVLDSYRKLRDETESWN